MTAHRRMAPKSSAAAAASLAIPVVGADQWLLDVEKTLRDIEEKLRELKSREKAVALALDEAQSAMFDWERQNPKPATVMRDGTGRFRDPKADLAQWELCRRAAGKEEMAAMREHEETVAAVDALGDEATKIKAKTLAGLQCKARISKLLEDGHEEIGPSAIRDLLALKPGAVS